MTYVNINGVFTSCNPHALTESIGLAYHGRDFLAARLRTATEALRTRHLRMVADRESRYRKVVGTGSLDRMAYELVVSSYPQGRRYALSMCRKLRGDIAAARQALAEWDAETEAAVAKAESRFLQAAE